MPHDDKAVWFEEGVSSAIMTLHRQLNNNNNNNRNEQTVHAIAIYVGCNKAMDAVNTFICFLRWCSKDVWRDRLF
jgi:hypothetical protein